MLVVRNGQVHIVSELELRLQLPVRQTLSDSVKPSEVASQFKQLSTVTPANAKQGPSTYLTAQTILLSTGNTTRCHKGTSIRRVHFWCNCTCLEWRLLLSVI